MTSRTTTMASVPIDSRPFTELGQLIATLVTLCDEVDHLWQAALGTGDFDTWNRLADASHSVHRALNCLTLEPLVGIGGC